MRFDIFSIFPQVFQPYLEISILKRAISRGLIEVHTHNIRDYATDKHHSTDDTPYGGGGGMVMRVEPVFAAVEDVLGAPPACPLIVFCPQGKTFNQEMARRLAQEERLGMICGRYESFDERIREHLATEVISIGDYVLTGGELPALVLLDAIARLQPGVLGDDVAAQNDSFSEEGLLEHPHYTKPPVYRGWAVPEVLQNGNLALQTKWKREQALIRTLEQRPDLLAKAPLRKEDYQFLEDYINSRLSADAEPPSYINPGSENE